MSTLPKTPTLSHPNRLCVPRRQSTTGCVMPIRYIMLTKGIPNHGHPRLAVAPPASTFVLLGLAADTSQNSVLLPKKGGAMSKDHFFRAMIESEIGYRGNGDGRLRAGKTRRGDDVQMTLTISTRAIYWLQRFLEASVKDLGENFDNKRALVHIYDEIETAVARAQCEAARQELLRRHRCANGPARARPNGGGESRQAPDG